VNLDTDVDGRIIEAAGPEGRFFFSHTLL
jgi:hypothetical protein